MSQESVETFKRGADAWNDDDFDTWIDLFHPELEWVALMEVYRGHAGARQAWESFKGDMQLTIRIAEVRDLGDSVLGLGAIEGTGHATGLNVGSEIAQLVRYRDGKAVSIRDFASHAEALEAASLSE